MAEIEFKNKTANAAFAGSATLLAATQTIDLPAGLDQFTEPVGLILALIGAALKLFTFFKTR